MLNYLKLLLNDLVERPTLDGKKTVTNDLLVFALHNCFETHP
jgi:hypothetical protein